MNMEHLAKQVVAVVEKNIERIVNEEGEAAAKRVQERVRRLAVDTAVIVAQNVSIHSFGHELTITLKDSKEWKTQELK